MALSVLVLAAGLALAAAQELDCSVADKYYYWELPAACCMELCNFACPGDRACFVSEQFQSCQCQPSSGTYLPGDELFEECFDTSFSGAAAEAPCVDAATQACLVLEDGVRYCKPPGEFSFALVTGLVGGEPGDVPVADLQAVLMMALFAIEDANNAPDSCGSTLRLRHAYRDDLGELSVGAFYELANTYDLGFVSLRSMESLYPLLAAAHTYGAVILSATATSEPLYSDDIYERVHPVAQSDKVLATKICDVVQELRMRVVGLVRPVKGSQDMQYLTESLGRHCPGVIFQDVVFDEADLAAFTETMRDSLLNTFLALGKEAARMGPMLEAAEASGRLGKGSQWLFIDRAVLHLAQTLSPAAQKALNGSLVVDQRQADDAKITSILDAHWGVTDLAAYEAFVPEFEAPLTGLYATFNPYASQYVRTMGASIYDSVRLLHELTCSLFPDGNVPGFYKASDAFWERTKPYNVSFAGATGTVRLEDSGNGRDAQTAELVVDSLVQRAGLGWALEQLGSAKEQVVFNGGSLEAPSRFEETCAPGVYSADDARHGCCALCGASAACHASEVCFVPDLRGAGGARCRCDKAEQVFVASIADKDSAVGRSIQQAADEFNSRAAPHFDGVTGCNKLITLEWLDVSGEPTTASLVSQLLARQGGPRPQRLDGVVGPEEFALAEAVGIVLGGTVPYLPLHPAERLAAEDISASLLRVMPSVAAQAQAMCRFYTEAGFQYINAFSLRGGEGVDLLESQTRACTRLGSIATTYLQTVSNKREEVRQAVDGALAASLNVHLVAISCDEPAFALVLEEALDAGLLSDTSAWVFPFWSDGCAAALSARVRAALKGSIFFGRTVSDADYAFDSVAALALGACAVAPAVPLRQGEFVSQVTTERRTSQFSGRSGAVSFEVSSGNRLAANESYRFFNLLEGEDGGLVPVPVNSISEAVFTGGTTTVPTDTVPSELQITQPIEIWIFNYILAGICFLAGAACMIWTWVNRAHPLVRVSQMPFLMLVILGTMLMSLSVVFLNVDAERTSQEFATFSCRAHIWLMAIGFELTFAPLFLRLYRILRLMRQSQRMRRSAPITNSRLALAVVAACLFDVVVLVLWQRSEDPLVHRYIVISTDAYGKPVEAVGVCSGDPVYILLIYSYHLVLLFFGSYVCWQNRGLSAAFSEHQPSANAIITVLQIQSVALPVFFMVREDPAPRIFVQGMMVGLIVLPTLAWIFVSKWLYMNGKLKDSGLGHGIIKDMSDRDNAARNAVRDRANQPGPVFGPVVPDEAATVDIVGRMQATGASPVPDSASDSSVLRFSNREDRWSSFPPPTTSPPSPPTSRR